MWVFEEEMIPREEFERRWPKASLKAWPDTAWSKLQKSWGIGGDKRKDVRIADYYVKEPIMVDQVLLSDGSIMTADEWEKVADELGEKGIEFVDAKKVETFKVMHYKMSGAEVLEQPVEVPFSLVANHSLPWLLGMAGRNSTLSRHCPSC